MHDHLVIAHIVAFGHLDDAIQDHGFAEELCLDKLKMLILGLFIRTDAFDAHALAIIWMQFFCKPDTHKRSNPVDIYTARGINLGSTAASRSSLRSAKSSAPKAAFRR